MANSFAISDKPGLSQVQYLGSKVSLIKESAYFYNLGRDVWHLNFHMCHVLDYKDSPRCSTCDPRNPTCPAVLEHTWKACPSHISQQLETWSFGSLTAPNAKLKGLGGMLCRASPHRAKQDDRSERGRCHGGTGTISECASGSLGKQFRQWQQQQQQ